MHAHVKTLLPSSIGSWSRFLNFQFDLESKITLFEFNHWNHCIEKNRHLNIFCLNLQLSLIFLSWCTYSWLFDELYICEWTSAYFWNCLVIFISFWKYSLLWYIWSENPLSIEQIFLTNFHFNVIFLLNHVEISNNKNHVMLQIITSSTKYEL